MHDLGFRVPGLGFEVEGLPPVCARKVACARTALACPGCWARAAKKSSPAEAMSVQGSGFRVQGSGFRVYGPGFRVQGSGFMV